MHSHRSTLHRDAFLWFLQDGSAASENEICYGEKKNSASYENHWDRGDLSETGSLDAPSRAHDISLSIEECDHYEQGCNLRMAGNVLTEGFALLSATRFLINSRSLLFGARDEPARDQRIRKAYLGGRTPQVFRCRLLTGWYVRERDDTRRCDC